MKKLILMALVGCICLLSGCDSTVHTEDISWANSMCRSNGGLKSIKNYSLRGQTITCGNGAEFNRSHEIFR